MRIWSCRLYLCFGVGTMWALHQTKWPPVSNKFIIVRGWFRYSDLLFKINYNHDYFEGLCHVFYPTLYAIAIYSLIKFRGSFYFDDILIKYKVMLINTYRNFIITKFLWKPNRVIISKYTVLRNNLVTCMMYTRAMSTVCKINIIFWISKFIL